MSSQSRAQRLVDEFEEGAPLFAGGFSIRHGIAAVLRHLADTEAGYADEESWYGVPARTLEELADALEAPTPPPSLKEQALESLHHLEAGCLPNIDLLRSALETIPDETP
jgi:hypothetical protein